MCGITGFYGKGERSDIEAMTQSLIHRGPDEVGYYQKSPLFFGHRRLVIRDQLGGRQPMTGYQDELTVIYNGQIYNERQLRKELELLGCRFESSHSDAEVLIHGYRQWGSGLVERLNGMWAFAILDAKKKKIFLSRDRFGKKPLYFTFQKGIFAFASELKALKSHKYLRFTVSSKNIRKYHGYGYFPGKLTIYNEAYKLPGGCNLFFDMENFGHNIERYWSYSIEPDYTKDERYWSDKIIDLLDKAVERRLVSDVPLGMFLSGGLDSAIVSFFARRKKINIESFSIGFTDPSFDETKDALFVSNLLGTQHSVTTLSPGLFPDIQKGIFDLLDEPFSDSSIISYYLLCKGAREKITVALGGDAGDELFAGYDTFKALKIADWLQKIIPKACHRGVLSMLARLPVNHSYMPLRFKFERLLRAFNNPSCLWNPLWLSPVSLDEIESIVREPVGLEELYSEAIETWEQCGSKKLLDKSLEFYAKIFLQDQILVKVDRLSMMHGLEVRVPFLDIDLVDCVRRIPSGLKLRNGHTKYILKKAAERYLPKALVWRRKIGFTAPLSKWFFDGTINLAVDPYWNKEAGDLISKKISKHRSLREDNRLFLWNCYVLNEFIRRSGLGA